METCLGRLDKHGCVVAADGIVVVDTVVEKPLSDGYLRVKKVNTNF